MKKTITLILFILLCALGSAVTITGVIKDASSDKFLSDVNIYSSVKNVGTISGSNGAFTIECTTNDTLIFSSLGYEELKLKAGDVQLSPLIKLNHYSYQLDEIKVISLTPKQLLQQVMDHYAENYGSIPVNINCDYNEYILKDDKLLNAALCNGQFINYFTTKHISGKQNILVPVTIKKFTTHEKYSNRQYVYSGNLFDNINLYTFISGLFEKIDLATSYNISDENFGSYEVYKMYIEGKSRTIMYIDKKSKAVLTFIRETDFHEPDIKIENDSCGFLSKNRKDGYTYISYRPYNNKWYINTIKMRMHVLYQTTEGPVTFESRALFQANAVSDQVDIKYRKRQLFNFNEPVYNQLHNYVISEVTDAPDVPDIHSIESYK